LNTVDVRAHFDVFKVFDSSARYYSSGSSGRRILKDRANAALSEFKFAPLIEGINEAWDIRWIPSAPHDLDAALSEGRIDTARVIDGEAVYQWLKLAELGLLPRLKRCAYPKCRKFFFAKFTHASFHSVKCRDAEAKENTIRRENRRAYERRYYRENLSKA